MESDLLWPLGVIKASIYPYEPSDLLRKTTGPLSVMDTTIRVDITIVKTEQSARQ